MPVDPKHLLQRYERLLARRRLHEDVWEQIAEQILPQRTGIISKRSPGEKRTTKLFDGTAPDAALLLASTMHSTLTPSAAPWFSVKYRDEALNDDKAVQDWSEDTVRRMDEAISNSTFDLHVMECYLDYVAFGICCMQIERNAEGGLQFQSVPVGQFVVDEDAEGRVDTVARSFTLTARAAVDRWGEEAVSEAIRNASTKEPEKPFTFMHWVGPRPEKEQTKKLKNMPWISAYVEVGAKTLVGKEAGFHEMPYVTPRWGKATGECYGYGPGHTALPFVQTLNELTRLFLKTAGKAADPPTASRWNGVVGPIKWFPGGNTVVRDINDFKEFPPQARLDIIQVLANDLRTEVRRNFHVDQLALKETPQMTALEVQVRFELMQRVLGPTLGRLRGEFFTPSIERVFGIMSRERQFLPVPAILRDYIQDVGEFDVQYEGPMARAQRTPELVAIERSYTMGGVIAQVYPAIFDIPDHDKVFRHIWQVTGAPSDNLRSEEEVKAIRDKRAQQEQAAAVGQLALGATEGAKNLAPIAEVVRKAGENGGVIPADQAR